MLIQRDKSNWVNIPAALMLERPDPRRCSYDKTLRSSPEGHCCCRDTRRYRRDTLRESRHSRKSSAMLKLIESTKPTQRCRLTAVLPLAHRAHSKTARLVPARKNSVATGDVGNGSCILINNTAVQTPAQPGAH